MIALFLIHAAWNTPCQDTAGAWKWIIHNILQMTLQ